MWSRSHSQVVKAPHVSQSELERLGRRKLCFEISSLFNRAISFQRHCISGISDRRPRVADWVVSHVHLPPALTSYSGVVQSWMLPEGYDKDRPDSRTFPVDEYDRDDDSSGVFTEGFGHGPMSAAGSSQF